MYTEHPFIYIAKLKTKINIIKKNKFETQKGLINNLSFIIETAFFQQYDL